MYLRIVEVNQYTGSNLYNGIDITFIWLPLFFILIPFCLIMSFVLYNKYKIQLSNKDEAKINYVSKLKLFLFIAFLVLIMFALNLLTPPLNQIPSYNASNALNTFYFALLFLIFKHY
jgi:hypothetical protein